MKFMAPPPPGHSIYVFSVSDTGCGIPHETQRHLFQEYAQVGVQHGTGMGLPLCKAFVELMGAIVAIMGADDYKEAHSRVGALRLKKAQLPEVARVLLDCCAQEGAFNPFYALLGAELCASREVRYSLQ